MAHISGEVGSQIERLLTYLERAWDAVPETAQEWPSWDPLEQEVFHLEWAVKEDNLDRLCEYERQGQIDPRQLSRLQELRLHIAQNRPLLERMLAT